ncbi:hypothetical protein DICPUDRAFT_99535 [Dictyostelium purpureum]|uniref:Protein kinase domain-containing protein n=1 Tax=Dictyostelium purpureum TaxID=5786 RepID=F1A043_DICPU|nr:uncharacterized protein DICPUDRAFT_99535 [Dictyostelium purpureum]EGC30433.1 hypothetical protein DICPUDRAFT_99535 [Dictyostelium purpureum]|eukprot:XP_003293033.1 hypothetical protein DICPUDRAFT_99535 [Dictyostelium purpureum]
MEQNNNNDGSIEQIRPTSYNYDVLFKTCKDSENDIKNTHMMHSHYGFYKGELNENKIKNGTGTFIFSKSIYTGQWNLDKRDGDGTMVLLKNVKSKPIPSSPNPLQQQQKSNTPIKKPTTPNNLSPRLTVTQRFDDKIVGKIKEKFNKREEIVRQQTDAEYLKQQDYYSGKWLDNRANGVGKFHFSGDGSTHSDFWRSGVAIRYANQNNILKPLSEDSLPAIMNSKDFLNGMIEDWINIFRVYKDEDFPCARPYLSTPTTSLGLTQNGSITPPQSSLLSPTQTPLSPPRSLMNSIPGTPISISDDEPTTSPPVSTRPPFSTSIPGSLQHSRTQPNVAQSQSPIQNNNLSEQKYLESLYNQSYQHKFLKQQVSKIVSTQPQSFGIYTAQYIKHRIDTEDKFFLSLIFFISKWVIPYKSFNVPNNQNTIASFIIFVPDLEKCTFVSLPNLIMQTSIMEKLIYKLLVDPLTKNLTDNYYSTGSGNRSPNSNSPNISPSTSSGNVSETISLPSSTPEEKELHKLFPVSLDLDDTPSTEKECMAAILNIFKQFPTIEGYQPPQFILDNIVNMVSIFKKTKALESYLLQKQFNTLKEYYFAFKTRPTSASMSSTSSPLSNASISLSSSSPSSANPKTLRSTKHSVPSLSVSPTGSSPTKSIITLSNKYDVTTSSTTRSNHNVYGTLSSRRKTLESIFPTKQNSNSDLLSSLMESTTEKSKFNDTLPELTLQSVNVLFSIFKSSYQFPESLTQSVKHLESIQQYINNMRNIINSKIKAIKEAKPKPNEYSLFSNNETNEKKIYNEYLLRQDQQIENLITNFQNDLSQLEVSFEVTQKLYKELASQQVYLTLKRLKEAHNFIDQLLNLTPNRTSKLPKEFTHRFIKHTHKITYLLLDSCNQSAIFKLEENVRKDVEKFIKDSSTLFSIVSSRTNGATSPTNASTPSPSNQSPTLSSISSPGIEYLLSKKSLSPTNSTNVLNIGQQSNHFIKTDKSYLQFEPSDILPGPISLISSLDKIPEEIVSGYYHLILPVASCGDELLVSVLSDGFLDLKKHITPEKLKDFNKSSLVQLFNILIHSTIISHNLSYIPEVFKILNLLLPFYPKKDELFIKYKDVLFGFMDLSFKDDSCEFGSLYLTFLALLLRPKKKGIRKDLKKEFVEMFPISLFISLLERPIVDATNKNAEKMKAQSAQILINLSISSSEYLLEVKNKNALAPILDICKFNQAHSHKQIEEGELTICEYLGEGALATVSRGIFKGKEVAVKIFNEGSFSFRLEDFLKEVAILGFLNHPNLLKLKGACIAPKTNASSTFMIVTELMHKGTLLDVINKNKPLSTQQIIKYALSVAQGLEYLHGLHFIHRDIKAANILVDKDNNAKVADFGMSRVIDINFNMTAVAGTPKWEAPECLIGETYTSAADVYSYGMLLFEMATSEEPYMEINSIAELFKTVCEKKTKPKIPSSCPSFLSNLIKDCLNNSPKKRPTMNQIIQKLLSESKKQ